jgi:hypothetical protein
MSNRIATKTVPSPADSVPAPAAEGRVLRGRRRTAVALAAAAGWVVLAAGIVIFAGGLFVTAAAGAVALLPRAVVFLALAAQDGAGWWSIAGRAAGALGAALATPQVLWWLAGLALIGVAALAGLHMMLRGEMRGTDFEEGHR